MALSEGKTLCLSYCYSYVSILCCKHGLYRGTSILFEFCDKNVKHGIGVITLHQIGVDSYELVRKKWKHLRKFLAYFLTFEIKITFIIKNK